MPSMPRSPPPSPCQVVEPHLNGPGGDVPVIVHDTRKGRVEVIADRARRRPAPPSPIIAARPRHECPAPACSPPAFPGMFDTWMTVLRDYGTPVRSPTCSRPRSPMRADGYPLVERANATIATVEKLFRDYWPTSAAVYLRGGKVPEPARCSPIPPLPDTYTRVLREAAGPGGPEQEIERARKVWFARLRRRSDRPVSGRTQEDQWTPADGATTASSPARTWHAGRRPSRRR